VAVMCDPARTMLFARIMLILAKMSTIKCLLKANGRGQSIPYLATPSARGSTAWWQSSAVLGSPLELKLLYIFGLSLVIPVP
jgi:hypothetical protein